MTARTDADYSSRYDSEGGQIHDYLKRTLADLDVQFLVPRCAEDEVYPERHDRLDLRDQIPQQRGRYRMCRRCLACRSRRALPSVDTPRAVRPRTATAAPVAVRR